MSVIFESSNEPDITLYGDNLEAFKSRKKIVILVGAAGTGKTYALCLKVHMLCIKYPGIKVLMCRKSLPSLRESIVKTFLHILEKTKHDDIVRVLGETRPSAFLYPYSEQEWDGKKYAGKSEITLRQIDMKGKALGAEYDVIYFNQPDTEGLTEEEFTQLASRARLSNAPYRQILADPNPAHDQHWLLLGQQAGKWDFFTSTHKDNPEYYDHKTGEWTEKGLEHIKQLEMLPDHLKKSQLEGQWYSTAGMAFADYWDPDVHTIRLEDHRAYKQLNISKIDQETNEFVNCVPKEWDHYLSIDWGGDDPFVAILVAKHPEEDLYIVHKHIYISHKDIYYVSQMTQEMCEDYNIKAVIADRSKAEIAVMERHLGLNIIGASKGSGSIESGMNLFIGELKANKWVFLDTLQSLQHERDPELLKKMRPMGYEEIPNLKKDPKNGIVAPKQQDHFYDAVRYLMRYLIENANTKKHKFIWLN